VPLRIHDEELSRRVGAVVLVVTIAVVVLVTTVKDRLGQGGVEIEVFFAAPTGLREGAAVRIAGRDVGTITGISIVPAHRTWRGHPLHGTGGLVVIARIETAWAARIPVDAELFVGARSFLAPRYLEIAPPYHAATPARSLRAGDRLRGRDPPELDRVLQRVWDDLGEMQRFAEEIRPSAAALTAAIARLGWLVGVALPGDEGWGELAEAARAARAEAGRLAGSLDLPTLLALIDRSRDVVERLADGVGDLRRRAERLAVAIDHAGAAIPADLRVRIDRAIAAVTGATGGAESLLAGVRGVLDDATAGTGTLAALGRDLELIDDMKAMTRELKRAPWRVVTPAR
jgi:ABC-type transporter Mla subunit MlaD